MPMHSSKNLYPGINLHLNSYLQDEPGGWESFDSGHVIHLGEMLDSILPPGYYTLSEKSLQISELNVEQSVARRSLTRPDVTIHHTGAADSGTASILDASEPVMVIPLVETIEPEDQLSGVVIYQVAGKQPAKPVTRLELLSPANKPGGSHYSLYRQKRRETLASGLNLIEIDYLHETPPITSVLKDYSTGESGAFPYTILVNNPHPALEEGITTIYCLEHVGDNLSSASINHGFSVKVDQ